ncbi:MAG: T9SS type A sorting domain-containing protein, partial [Brumimicrobium sp.]
THSYTDTDSLGVELHIMFYQYRTWDYLNDVTFVNITAINRSNTDYPEFIHSIVVDANIGNSEDDYYGCDSLNNSMYFYNADNNDEDGASNLGYGIDPPAIGIVGLNQNMSSCVPYTNSGLNISNKWNLMKGLQPNGDPWLNPNSNETKYVFSGNPNTPSEWSALSVGEPTGEAKGIFSFDFGSFSSGDTLKQSYAITYARVGNNLDNIQSIIDLPPDVKSFYENESNIPCSEGTWNLEEMNDLNVTISPNPSSGIVNLSNPDKTILSLTICDSRGKVLKELSSFNKNTTKIDLSSQSSGVYFFHIKTEKANAVKKIVMR